ncbi:3-hydroxybutyrate dehydrogenase [Fictibacillus macauensis ZFHKF-1]|uniref:3-hydroxybutyrate dehydrogenase n=1 Tax=Fictibacillus macauensis ZFHKF-1 TaxID=1196324 RepID=I8UGP6_9BACL|nr:3-hydroxybutyrate dehydrogenase [Fictibacillus macauensis]EIT85963.1 3-hydroxybutyrate dehydrogenase [Fictibacillus macauensis ZFHKF-1]
MEQRLQGKTALITGSASGIGLKIAEEFAQHGANIIISDLNEEKVSKTVSSFTQQGFSAIGVVCDVTNETQLDESIEAALSNFGSIDLLINNAGFQHVSPIEDFPTATFEKMIAVMLTAPFIAIKKVFPIMKKQKFGRIINMASINGVIGFAGKAAYNSAKHGVIGLTKVAAIEGASHGITVNALCPGYVDTPLVQNQLKELAETRNVAIDQVFEEVIFPLVPQKRLLDVQEIADYAVFLASEQARGVTGQAVLLDGGYTAQ